MYSEIGGFMAKNFYAVRSGRETGIFKTWNECKRYITGFKGAEYKGFMTLEEAEEYMGNASVSADDFDLYSIPEGSAAAVKCKKAKCLPKVYQKRAAGAWSFRALPFLLFLRVYQMSTRETF